ncbi:MAG: membrane-associated protease RseP (regulator of RpoE activity), partial [Patescibacteria group bacterium]
FLGVYTSTSSRYHPHSSSNGLRINGVIENTPAFDAGLLKGDRILALDGVSVDNHKSLLAERNKHEAGDEFTLTFLRDGDEVTVDAKFKECKEEEKEIVTEEEAIEERTEEQNVNNLLDINLSTFPNPTNSSVNIRFVGERTATIVTVTDIKGKEIFREELNNFDGLYNNKINLNGAATGAVIISVQQGNKISSKKVLYMPDRA